MKMTVKTLAAALTAAMILSTGLVQAQAAEHPGLAIVKANDCFTCHRLGQKLIGPAYKDVAAKYKGADDAKITELANKIIVGGFGNWGAVAMRAHPLLSVDDAKKAVSWVLTLADAPAAGAEAAPAAAVTTTTTTTTTTTPAPTETH